MSSITHVVGIDPGLIHTGVVSLMFYPAYKVLEVDHRVVDGPDDSMVSKWLMAQNSSDEQYIFIEKYVPRLKLGSDERMVKAEAAFSKTFPTARLINNTGSKGVIRTDLMHLLKVWTFLTVTHHQDLRAAARIGLYGMVKVPSLNKLLVQVVSDHMQDSPWEITT